LVPAAAWCGCRLFETFGIGQLKPLVSAIRKVEVRLIATFAD
jgi:hypothetical protein